jgi:hypothetical protein
MITMQCIGKLCKKFPQLKRIFAGTSSSQFTYLTALERDFLQQINRKMTFFQDFKKKL